MLGSSSPFELFMCLLPIINAWCVSSPLFSSFHRVRQTSIPRNTDNTATGGPVRNAAGRFDRRRRTPTRFSFLGTVVRRRRACVVRARVTFESKPYSFQSLFLCICSMSLSSRLSLCLSRLVSPSVERVANTSERAFFFFPPSNISSHDCYAAPYSAYNIFCSFLFQK